MMTPRRPYFIRAIYEWIGDNNCTPYIIVNTKIDNVNIPLNYAKDGRIVLNISLTATNKLRIGNDAIEFEARFGGKITYVYVPINAVLAIYAKENNLGMIFTPEDIENYELPSHQTPPATTSQQNPPHLKLLQDNDEDDDK